MRLPAVISISGPSWSNRKFNCGSSTGAKSRRSGPAQDVHQTDFLDMKIVQPELPLRGPAHLWDDFNLIVAPTIESNRHFLPFSAGGYPRILILKRALFISAEHLEEEISGAE